MIFLKVRANGLLEVNFCNNNKTADEDNIL